jgi:hypothetical protein
MPFASGPDTLLVLSLAMSGATDLVAADGSSATTPAAAATNRTPAARRVYVSNFTSTQDPKLARMVSHLVAVQLSRQGFEVVSSADLEAVFGAEAQRQAVGCDADSCLTDLAAALDVELIAYGQLSRLRKSMIVVVSIFDAPASRAVSRDSIQIDNLDLLPTELERSLTRTLGSSIPTTEDPLPPAHKTTRVEKSDAARSRLTAEAFEEQAFQAIEEEDWCRATRLFERANALVPAVALLSNAARAAEFGGDLATARSLWRQIGEEPTSTVAERTDAKNKVVALNTRIARESVGTSCPTWIGPPPRRPAKPAMTVSATTTPAAPATSTIESNVAPPTPAVDASMVALGLASGGGVLAAAGVLGATSAWRTVADPRSAGSDKATASSLYPWALGMAVGGSVVALAGLAWAGIP